VLRMLLGCMCTGRLWIASGGCPSPWRSGISGVRLPILCLRPFGLSRSPRARSGFGIEAIVRKSNLAGERTKVEQWSEQSAVGIETS